MEQALLLELQRIRRALIANAAANLTGCILPTNQYGKQALDQYLQAFKDIETYVLHGAHNDEP